MISTKTPNGADRTLDTKIPNRHFEPDILALHEISYNFEIARAYVRKEFERQVKFIQENIFQDFHPILRVRRRGIKCYGGTKMVKGVKTPAINICTIPFLELHDETLFQEYEEFSRDPDIGSFVGHWKKVAAAFVAHELAHAIHKSVDPRLMYPIIRRYSQFSKNIENEIGGHRRTWQTLYCILRSNLVNTIRADENHKFGEDVQETPRRVKRIPVSGLGRRVILRTKGSILLGYEERIAA